MQISLSRKWSGRVTHQRFVMRDREREGEPRVAAPSRCRAAFTPCRSRGVFIRPRHRMSCARVLTTCSAHWGHLSPLYSCTVHCTAVQLSHQQHHYILSHRQSVSNSGSSQTLVTKCREILSSPVKNFDIIWLRSVLWPWMTLMKNFICGYLDSDNHHDIVSIFWLGKKIFCAWKKNIFLHTKIFLRWVFSGHVTARSMSRQPFDAEWDFIWHNAYHKVTLTQNSDVMKKYPAGKNTTIFSSVTKNCLNCLMLPPSLRNEHLGRSNICCAGDKVQRSQTLWFPKITRETKTLNYTKIFHWGSKKNIPFSGCHLSTALHLGQGSVIRDQNYPQSISCVQRAATGCSVCY